MLLFCFAGCNTEYNGCAQGQVCDTTVFVTTQKTYQCTPNQNLAGFFTVRKKQRDCSIVLFFRLSISIGYLFYAFEFSFRFLLKYFPFDRAVVCLFGLSLFRALRLRRAEQQVWIAMRRRLRLRCCFSASF